MPVPPSPLRSGDRGSAVAELHRTFGSLDRVVDQGERGRRTFGRATEDLLREFQTQSALPETGVFDADTRAAVLAMLADMGPFTVYGRLTDAGGTAIAGATIVAVDVDLRRTEVLGQAKTDSVGDYEVRYAASKFTRAEKSSADLVVRAMVDDECVAESPVMFNAPQDAEINLQVPDPGANRSEFERHVDAIAPLLVGQAADGGDLPIATLTDRDIDFVAGDTGIERQQVAWLSTAFAHSARTTSGRMGTRRSRSSPRVAAAVFYGWFREGIPDQWDTLIELSISTLRAVALVAIADGIIPAELESTLDKSLDAMPSQQRDSLHAAVALTGLGKKAVGTILRHAGTATELSNPLVSKLVDEGSISKVDAHRVGLALAAHDVVGGDEAAMEAILGAKPVRLAGSKLRRARDLASLDGPELQRVLGEAKVSPAAGMTLPDYAVKLAGLIAERFPTEALLYRATTVPDDIVASLARVVGSRNGAAKDQAVVISASPGEDAAAQGPDPLRQFVNLHPGLRLGAVIQEASDADSALSTISKRVGWVERVLKLNPNLDLLAVDYLRESPSLRQVKFGRLSEEARSMVVENMKAYQRIQSVRAGAADGIKLLEAGYGSATAIAESLPSEIAGRTGLTLAGARGYHAIAEGRATEAALAWIAFHDLERDAHVMRNGALPQPPAYLAELRGYADLFGTPIFCHCKHCQSVLGPAAYFVDLMFFVERHILDPSFNAHGGERHDLHLRSRRPDLWDFELTCDNTNKVVPTLDLVNELLERYIVHEKRLTSTARLYERLATVDHSIRLPISLPLERLSLWLGHLDIERSEIADTLLLSTATAGTRARIRLRMLRKQFDLITTSRLGDASPSAIRAAEGFFMSWLEVNLTLSTIPGEAETRALDPIGALPFSRAIGSDSETLADVFATDFVNGDAAGAPRRVRLEGGIGTEGGVQNDTEVVRNLTSARLDRFERFVRLWRHVPWTVAELDYVVGRLLGTGPLGTGAPGLGEPVVIALARLLAVQEQLHISVEELCTLCDEVPSVVLRGERSLFESIFDPPLDPALLIDATSAVRGRLAAALQIDDEALTVLTERLGPCLGSIENGTFVKGRLNKRNLSLIVRYARLARLLKLSVPALLQTVALTSRITSKAENERCILTLDDLTSVLEVHRWRVASGFTIPEIQVITNSADAVVAGNDDPEELAARIVGEIASDKSLQLPALLFTQIGLTEAEATAMITDNCEPVGGNPPLLERTPGADAFRIRRDAGPDTISRWFRFDPEPREEAVETAAEAVFEIVRRGGQRGFERDDLVPLGLSATEAHNFVRANLSDDRDERPFELVPNSASRYRLRAAMTEAVAVKAFGRTSANVETARVILTFRAREIVTRSYPDVAKDIYRIVRQAGDEGFEPRAAFEALGLSAAEADAFVTGNLAPGGPFEQVEAPVGSPVRYRRRANLSEAAAIANFGAKPGADTADFLATKSILRHRAVDLVRQHLAENVLAAKVSGAAKTTPERTRELVDLALPSGAEKRQALVDALQGGPPPILSDVLARLMRYAVLFRSPAYDPQALEFVRTNPGVLALADPPTAETIRRVSLYATLARAPDPAFGPEAPAVDTRALQAVLTSPNSVAAATASKSLREEIVKALKSDERQIGDALGQIVFPTGTPAPRIDELAHLADVLVLMRKLGPPAEILSLSVSENSAELARGADGVLAAIHAKYTDEDTLRQKLEPFEDILRSQTRDALVEYLLSAPDDATTDWRERFTDANDLYHHFLTDVMAGGCARTSKIVAATMSLQLYVQRVIMNLEHTRDIPIVAARFDSPSRQKEWEQWRKNYQVWVANRKVFLYPETYLEPGLRDDKTPIFRDLEDTLLQQEIGDATVDDAYGRYLLGFEALSRLKIAGACYDQTNDTLHLFGASHNDPPVFYYRRMDDAKSARPVASAWQPLTLQIPTRNVSPVLFNDRLYVFWLETTTRTVTTFTDGNSDFTGYQHAVRIKYSMQRADKRWTPPHSLRFWVGGATEEARIISDPQLTDEKALRASLNAQIAALGKQLTDLQEPVEEQAKEAERRHTAVRDAQIELKQPLPGITQEETNVAVAAGAAARVAGFLAAPAGPIAAAAASLAAWLEVVALFIPMTVAGLQAAGVNFDDRLITARRKVKLWEATLLAAIADRILALLTEARDYLTAEKNQAEAAIPVVSVRWDRSGRDHTQPLDNYQPAGWEWERVYPDVHVPTSATEPGSLRLVLVPTNDSAPGKNDAGPGSERVALFTVDLFSGLLRPITVDDGPDARERPNNSNGRLTLVQTSHKRFHGQEFFLASLSLHESVAPGAKIAIADRDATVQAVTGDPLSVIVEFDGEPVWVRSGGGGSYSGLRLGTTLVPELTTAFGQKGAPTLLTRDLQNRLTERPSRIVPVDEQDKPEAQSPFYRANPFVTYFKETFFHIPFSIADHLNSQQRFAESQRWYHRIFDPTAIDGIPWRYREFQALSRTGDSLRATLTDSSALAAYRADPFNPHAIARLRPGAYEKAIVMKYVDNLLDWGDMLFARFTMESVNEAMMLYVMAADVLGPRPVELGGCGQTSESTRTYDSIAPLLRPSEPNAEPTADFLIEEFEVFMLKPGKADLSKTFVLDRPKERTTAAFASTAAFAATAHDGGGPELGQGMAVSPGEAQGLGYDGSSAKTWKVTEAVPLKDLYSGNPIGGAVTPVLGGEAARTLRIPGDPGRPVDPVATTQFVTAEELLQHRKFGQFNIPKGLEPADFALDLKYDLHDVRGPGALLVKGKVPSEKLQTHVKPFELARARLVFCIPRNEELTSYWDRVDDRLNKIRSCMDIAGVRRRLELFAPEIDPRLLVRMRAAGLSLDDVMNVTSGNLPPYRFTYLIEKAKQHASVVQSFGSQVLSALEKRDSEELTRLRTVHEQNLLKLRSHSTQLEIDTANDTIASFVAQRAAVLYRQQYFTSLSSAGLLAPESKNQQLQQTAAGFRTMAGISQVVASVLSIIPDLGAPTAMKFGGSQLGAAARSMAESFNAAAAFTEMGASMAGVEASNRRRDQEWRHQAEMAKRELAQLDKQIAAAEIRRDIAIESQKVHERSLDQVEEIFDFLRDRFTSFGRFTWLSAELQKVHRMAFNAALSMARLAEQAYRFERPDRAVSEGLTGNYWDAGNAGLLAGDRLILDLHNLERSFTETNYRTLEIEQSFSLARCDPDALSKLKTECVCDFEIPEWFFDLTYPGHYRRRIKAVRLTIPCVVGPHVNVGATLRLNGSHIRKDARLESAVSVPLRHLTAIAASMGQSDAGVFEFSFRDERYMPFEGAGVNSQWQLSLPNAVKAFDYGTISDVILRISYTAEEDSGLRAAVESATGVLSKLTELGVTRILSLRNDFPDAWNALVEGASQTTINIGEVHIPFFMSAFELTQTAFELLVAKLEETPAVYPTIKFDDAATTASGLDGASGLYRLGLTQSVSVVSKHTLEITALGSVGILGSGGDSPRLDASKIKDIMLRVVLRRKPPRNP